MALMARMNREAKKFLTEERRAQVMAAALRLMSKKGFESTSMEDIAEEADLAKGTVYLYFQNKEALLREVLETQTLAPALLPALETINPNDPLPVILPKLLAVLWEALKQREDAIRMLLREGSHRTEYSLLLLGRTLPVSEALTQRLRELVGPALAPDIDPFIAIRALVSMLLGLFVEQYILGGKKMRPMSEEAILRTVSGLFIHGVMDDGAGGVS